jgi:hypothetical protein
MSYCQFWYFLKDNVTLRVSEKKPKRARYIEEIVDNNRDYYGQTTVHCFKLYQNDIFMCEKQLKANCGYDRGPKRENIIKSMLIMK